MNINRPQKGPISFLLSLIEVEKPSDRVLLRVLFFVALFSGIASLILFNTRHSVPTPISGGEMIEGVVGSPRFINPTLATTRAEQDLVALTFSGVLRISQDGTLVPDMAESVTVSDDGLTYNIIIRKDMTFHDGTPVTARDVAFTYELIQNPDLKSPLRGNWTDVTIEQINEYELNIILTEPYAPFEENFLVGILPAHIWAAIPIEQMFSHPKNIHPIGSGLFSVTAVLKDTAGIISEYQLESYTKNRRSPHIDSFIVRFYQNEASLETAFRNGELDATAYLPVELLPDIEAQGGYAVITEPLPRIFGVFFNQNKSAALRDAAVRQALSISSDRSAIIANALYGYGVPIYDPVTFETSTLESGERSPVATSSEAIQILDSAGWIKNNLGLLEKQIEGSTETLSFTLRTSNATLFTEVSEQLIEDWKAIGVDVAVEQFEQTDLLQSVIRPRDFEALLFGIDMNRTEDLFPFWHSSQKDDPGLNIAQYTNLTVDSLLSEAKAERNKEIRAAKQQEAAARIKEENPAVFLFRPQLNYVVREGILIPPLPPIGRISDRFSTIDTWYTDSDQLWNLFSTQ
jgi:peptide/nickel transport system substrate-binding protein